MVWEDGEVLILTSYPISLSSQFQSLFLTLSFQTQWSRRGLCQLPSIFLNTMLAAPRCLTQAFP